MPSRNRCMTVFGAVPMVFGAVSMIVICRPHAKGSPHSGPACRTLPRQPLGNEPGELSPATGKCIGAESQT
jgi:hypothetical protein